MRVCFLPILDRAKLRTNSEETINATETGGDIRLEFDPAESGK